jgi:hypothetical protein
MANLFNIFKNKLNKAIATETIEDTQKNIDVQGFTTPEEDFTDAISEVMDKTTSYKGISPGDMVENTNKSCIHYGSKGKVLKVESLPNDTGYVIHYQVTNEGTTYSPGDVLTKTEDQLEKIS